MTSYGGLNYNSVGNFESIPNEVKVNHMGSVKKLDGYCEIEIPPTFRTTNRRKIKPNYMKKILLLLIVTLTISCNHNAETLYKGILVDKHYVDPSSGYKSHQEEQYQIYMREDVTQKVIKVNTNVPTYYSLEKGSRVAFNISNFDMYVLGNTSDSSLNLYGK